MEKVKTIVIYSTEKKSFVVHKDKYKKSSKHKYYAEVDLPEEFDFGFDKKKEINRYITNSKDVQNFIVNEIQKLVDISKA